MTKRIIFLLLLSLVCVSSALAQTDVAIDFESQPDVYPARPFTIGPATFSGVIVNRQLRNLPENPSAVAFTGTEIDCNGCGASRDVVITFSRPVHNVAFDMFNGVDEVHWPALIFYHVYINDDPEPQSLFFGWYRQPGGFFEDWYHRVSIFEDEITKIRITPGFDNDLKQYWNYGFDNFSFTTNRTIPVRVVTGFGDPDTDPDTNPSAVKKEVGGKQVRLDAPLGADFYVKMQRQASSGAWVDIGATYKPAVALLEEKDKLYSNALWKNYVALGYGPDSSASYRRFQAVHLGYVNIFVDPNDDAIGPLSVTLRVVRSDLQLGPTRPPTGPNSIRNDTTYDGRFLDYAHRSGIPPHFLKAQADQESELGIGIMDPRNWRYELYTTDNNFIQQNRNNCRLISQSRNEWSPYGCQLWPGYLLPSGHQLCPRPPGIPPNQPAPLDCAFGQNADDLSMRYRTDLRFPLKLSRNGQIRTIQAGDDPVMAYEIHYAKNGIILVPPGQGTPSGRRRAVAHPFPYNFVAQTAVASSYGLLQVLWTTANDFDLKWAGINGRHNPSLLFDTEFAEANGGGSFDLGTRYLLRFFDRQNPGGVGQQQTFASSAAFTESLRNMFAAYNPGMSTYGDAVIARTGNYTPQFTKFFPFLACSAPTISSQTESVVAGSSALLGVVASGEDLLKYEWFEQRPGAAAQKIAETTEPQFSVSPSLGSSYFVKVTSECGGSTSSASIAVLPRESCTPPRITQPPVDRNVPAQQETELSVVGSANATYKWYIGEVGTAPGELGDQSHPVPNGDTPTVRVTPQGTTKYWVLVSNSCGVDTAAVTLTVCDPPVVNVPPASRTITRGDSVPLSVSVTSADSYQWYAGVPPSLDHPIDGANAETYNATPQETTSYFVRVTNGCTSVNSAPALITVNEPCVVPSISAQSSSKTITRGEATTLSITPAGSEPRTIQWYAGGTAIDDANAATLEVTPNDTTTYHARVSNACGEASSTPVTITVIDACVPASISAQSSSTTITRGEATTLSITPGGSTPRTIQWYAGTTAISGASSATYEASPTATTTYRAVVTNDCGEAASTPVVITVVEACVPASISSQSSSVTIVRGESTTLSITPAGSTPRTIQWYTGTPGAGSSLPVNGANAATLEVAPIATVSYFAIVSNDCGSATSTPVTVTVTTACVAPSVTAQSESTSIVRGESTTLSVTANGTTPRTVQWYTGTPANASYIEGATNTTLTVSPTSTTSYFAIVSNACGAANSTPVTVTVTEACVPASITAQSNTQIIASGESATLSISVAGSTPRAIQWYTAEGTAIPGATSTSVTVSPVVTASYYARVSNSCGSDQSALIQVIVDCDRPSISVQPQPETIEEGETVTLSVTASDVASYQWYRNFAPIPGATSHTLTHSPSSSGQYFVRLTNDCGITDSATVTVTVTPPSCDFIFITQQPQNRAITEGQSATLTVAVTGTSPQYQWEQNINGVWTRLTGKTASSLTVTPEAGTHSYRVIITNACSFVTSGVATVTVGQPCTPPQITQQPVDPDFTFVGQTATLSVSATGSNLQYEWFRNGVSWSTTSSIQVSAMTQPQQFHCVVSNACGSQTSVTITIEAICDLPQTTIVSVSDSVVPPGGSSVLRVNSSGTPLLRWQLYEQPVGGSASVISSGTGMSVPNATVVPPATSDYWYEVTNECGTTSSNTVRITVQ